MGKTPKVIGRSCIACHTSGDKRNLVRFVRLSDGTVELDPSGKKPGRGAYLCKDMDCFADARRRRRLASALKVNLLDDDYDRLGHDLESYLARDAQ